MAQSPEEDSDGPVRVVIYSEGEAIDDTVAVVSVDVFHQFNRVPIATIECLDGDITDQTFPVSDDDTFIPGKAIKICAGYDDSEETIFEGIVIRHGINISGEQGAKLQIECRDKALGMTIGRKNANYVDQKDSDIITAILGNYSGLTTEIEATTQSYAELVQYQSTDWDFIVSRAEVNGQLVSVAAGKVTVQAPQTSETEVLTVTYGEDIVSFNADVDAQHQYATANVASWDLATQAIVEQEASQEDLTSQGNLSASDLSDVLAVDDFRHQSAAPIEADGLTAWAKGQQLKSGLARVRGRLTVQGTDKAIVGAVVDIVGVGERLSGKALMSGVRQRIENGQWLTDIEFGLSPNWFSSHADVTAPMASSFLPAVSGLQVGKVLKLDGDPAAENRIQISLPVMANETEGIWARLVSYSASNTYGHFCIPDVGDEVVVGYFNNDPCHPVILGSVYSSSLAPAETITAENYIQALLTKTGLSLRFDDEKKVITLLTPGGHQIELDDDAKTLSLTDITGNSLVLSDSGVALDSPKDISITATGKITLDAVDAVAISSKADVTAEGLNVEMTAQVGFTGKGSATAEVSASGQTTIKGAMVMIN